MNPMKVVWGLALAAFLAAAVSLFLLATARAHEHDGIVYEPSCCNSAITSPTGDCAPISDQYVTQGADGYHIDIPVGGHPQLKTKGYIGVVPYSQVKRPIDNRYHICLATDGVMRFCFFPKPGTS